MFSNDSFFISLCPISLFFFLSTLYKPGSSDFLGSRRVFGAVVERRVVILVDCSGSMALQLDTVKQHLVSLIWDQLQKQNIKLVMLRLDCEHYNPGVTLGDGPGLNYRN